VHAIDDSGIKELKNMHMSAPLSYVEFIYLLMSVDWVVTDSGGIQEEAVSLGKFVLVLRDVTERVECFWEGLGRLVGTRKDLIMQGLQECYEGVGLESSNVFGDGNAVQRITTILKSKLCDVKCVDVNEHYVASMQ
jgi:UDP-N-acetylglucosamine 2-epimerase (non-hydrolysing)